MISTEGGKKDYTRKALYIAFNKFMFNAICIPSCSDGSRVIYAQFSNKNLQLLTLYNQPFKVPYQPYRLFSNLFLSNKVASVVHRCNLFFRHCPHEHHFIIGSSITKTTYWGLHRS